MSWWGTRPVYSASQILATLPTARKACRDCLYYFRVFGPSAPRNCHRCGFRNRYDVYEREGAAFRTSVAWMRR